MRKLAVAVASVALVLMAAPAAVHAQQARPGGFGIGVGQGTGTFGVSGKVHTGDTAMQGVIGNWWDGWGPRWARRARGTGLGLSVDFLVSMPPIHSADEVYIAWNVGGGGATGIGVDWLELRGQFVAGLEFVFPDVPLDVVIEWRPSLRIIPPVDRPFNFGGAGFHVRYYFE